MSNIIACRLVVNAGAANVVPSQRTYDEIITSLLRQTDVATLLWRCVSTGLKIGHRDIRTSDDH